MSNHEASAEKSLDFESVADAMSRVADLPSDDKFIELCENHTVRATTEYCQDLRTPIHLKEASIASDSVLNKFTGAEDTKLENLKISCLEEQFESHLNGQFQINSITYSFSSKPTEGDVEPEIQIFSELSPASEWSLVAPEKTIRELILASIFAHLDSRDLEVEDALSHIEKPLDELNYSELLHTLSKLNGSYQHEQVVSLPSTETDTTVAILTTRNEPTLEVVSQRHLQLHDDSADRHLGTLEIDLNSVRFANENIRDVRETYTEAIVLEWPNNQEFASAAIDDRLDTIASETFNSKSDNTSEVREYGKSCLRLLAVIDELQEQP